MASALHGIFNTSSLYGKDRPPGQAFYKHGRIGGGLEEDWSMMFDRYSTDVGSFSIDEVDMAEDWRTTG